MNLLDIASTTPTPPPSPLISGLRLERPPRPAIHTSASSLVVPLDSLLTDGAFIIDNSTLSRYQTCPRSHQFYAINSREQRAKRSALAFGSIMHEVLRSWYSDAYSPTQEEWSYLYTIFGSDISEDDHRQMGFAIDVFNAYKLEYPTEPFSVNRDLVERSFLVPLGSINVLDEKYEIRTIELLWSGRLDLFITWPDGTCGILDHKTASVAGEQFWAQFQNSQPQLGYIYAARHNNWPASSFTINALFCRKPTRTGKGTEFARNRYPIIDSQLTEWRSNTRRVIQTLINSYTSGSVVAYPNSCVGKYGACEYLQICSQPPESRDSNLDSNLYRPVTWSPLD